jgi:flavin-dependent dehydrogenase
VSNRYDVIIVGGGYAGLCCALKLKGKRVLVLESRKEIGKKHRGSQSSLYPSAGSYDLEGNDIFFHRNDIRVANAVMARLTHLEFESGGHKLFSAPRSPVPIVDEGRIKGTIEGLCREAGVEIVTGARVRVVETDGKRASVYTDKKYDADYLVGADGAHSIVMRRLPLKRRRIGTLVELELEAGSMDVPGGGFYAEMRNVTTGLYAQPYGEEYMLGVFQGMGMNGERVDLKRYLEESIKKLKVKNITRRYAYSMPVNLSAPCSYYKNVAVAGDAVSSFSMATIRGAMVAGLLAGEAVLKSMEGYPHAFGEYDKEWREALGQKNLDNTRYFFFLLRRLNEKRMARLFKTLAGSDLRSVGKGYYVRRIPGIVRAFL